MQVAFVAGFGPVVRDVAGSHGFWSDALGIALEQAAPSYWVADDLAGVRHFALWPLEHAAASCFGTDAWPDDLAVPSTWLELDLGSADDVAPAAAELVERGHRLLKEPTVEPWGQTVARLLSPEGILLGLTYTPSMHGPPPDRGPGHQG
jgi:catechol 2,3-dioxygenase-like lactoylglutathione lyase family enzyme